MFANSQTANSKSHILSAEGFETQIVSLAGIKKMISNEIRIPHSDSGRQRA